MIRVRALTLEEQQMIERLAHSRTAEARVVERAQMIWHASQGLSVPAIASELGLHAQTVRHWLKRFNALGLEGLHDQPRGGRPATYTPEQVADVIATALTDPQTLRQPFACWTLDRLEAYLNEETGIPIKRSRIDDLLIAEGLRWRQQETWFGERPDPEFAKKRGPSKPSTPRRPHAAP
jgi:transposase